MGGLLLDYRGFWKGISRTIGRKPSTDLAKQTGDELSVLLELEGLPADERSDSQSLVVCGGITEKRTPTPWKFSRCGHFL
jgi:hypothetical protein